MVRCLVEEAFAIARTSHQNLLDNYGRVAKAPESERKAYEGLYRDARNTYSRYHRYYFDLQVAEYDKKQQQLVDDVLPQPGGDSGQTQSGSISLCTSNVPDGVPSSSTISANVTSTTEVSADSNDSTHAALPAGTLIDSNESARTQTSIAPEKRNDAAYDVTIDRMPDLEVIDYDIAGLQEILESDDFSSPEMQKQWLQTPSIMEDSELLP